MNFWRSLAGTMEVELTSAELPKALTDASNRNLEIIGMQVVDELTCRFRISRRQYEFLRRMAEKRGDVVKIRSREGLYWQGRRIVRRPVLTAGLALFLVLTLFLPTRILFVQVDGNDCVPDRLILEAADRQGVRFGAQRREIRSERVKNGILSDLPELQWVGVNTTGCVATVSVRERSETEPEPEGPQVSRIVADRDGYILSGTAVRGTQLIQPGQTVRKGQVLISGYTDCGFCIRADRAEGEIFAQTKREVTTVTSTDCLQRGQEQGRKRKISLLLRKKRINLWKDSGISDTTCGRMYAEYYVTLPGGFRLPAALCVEEYIFYDTAASQTDPETSGEQMKEFSRRYLQQQMVAGIIRQSRESLSLEDGCITLRGSYVCEEMIGREQPEQIGEANGKNN